MFICVAAAERRVLEVKGMLRIEEAREKSDMYALTYLASPTLS